MEFLECDNEMRRNQPLKDIAIAKREERAIKETLENERQEIKQNTSIKLDPSVPFFVPKLSPLQPQDTRENRENLDRKPPVPTREKSDTAIKEENSAPTNSQPARATYQTEMIDTKPNVTQIYSRDNPGSLTPTVQPRTQQQENFAVNSQPVLVPTTIYRESSTQETLRELINLQAKQAELSFLLVEQQKRNGFPAKEPPVFSENTFIYPPFTTAFDLIISGNVHSNRWSLLPRQVHCRKGK